MTYRVTTAVCTFDDPKDGLAMTGPANPCPAAAAVAGAPAEVNPDDFRRVTYTLTWTARSRTGRVEQTTLIGNPAGGLGPRITRFDEPLAQITADSLTWGGITSGLRLNSTSAAAVHWTADDGTSGDVAAGGPTDWGFTWDFRMAFSTDAALGARWHLQG